MADSSNLVRSLNPWVLHLQKLGLELKCPLCLDLFNQPMLLPCNHIFCDICVPRSTQFGSQCPVCKQQCSEGDVRRAPYMENLVAIYRSLDATFSTDAGRVPQQSPVSLNINTDNDLKESNETSQEGIASNGQFIFSLTTNKRIQASLDNSAAERNNLNGKSDKFIPHDRDRVVFCGGLNASKRGELGAEEMHINQAASPVSPHLVDPKCIDDDSSDPGSSNVILEKCTAKRSAEVGGETKVRTSTACGEDHARDIKRQKKLDYGLFDMVLTSNGCTQPNVFHSESAATSKLERNFGDLSTSKTSTISAPCDTNRSICAFCQSSGITDRSGPMMHFLSGKEVVGDAATKSNVIHVHKICIEWTPQVYFVGEVVKNLKAEVARAGKLKCSSCGLRGAALGCFVKSCRKSYHVPCAAEILGCRWDFEDFLMLCPSHSSVKFPREKKFGKLASSEKQHFVPTEMTSKQSEFWGASPNGVKKWVLCGSALSAEEKYLLDKFASTCGATVSKFWNSNVTHVIAATDANGACSRTLKVLKAILNGTWILSTDWIKACMEAKRPLDEEPYEVSLDNHGCCDGPKTGRLMALDNVPKLFDGFSFYFSGDFIPAYKEDLLDLVITGGGTVVESKERLVAQFYDAQTSPLATLVVYNSDPMQVRALEEDGPIVLRRLEAAENLAFEIGSRVIAHTWLLESIAACKLQPFGC